MKRAALILLPLLLTGCDPMAEQARIDPYELPPPGSVVSGALPPPPGTVSIAAPDPGQPPTTPALLERGRDRYGIYCMPCHGAEGRGDGYVAGKLVPHPPSLFSPELMQATDARLFEVITHGHGRMYSYASRIPPQDRWAIVAYERHLQETRP